MDIIEKIFEPEVIIPILGIIIPAILIPVYKNIKRKKQLLNVFQDMSRHFWRNAVVLAAIRKMLLLPENLGKRPSEMHFIKLKNLEPGTSFFYNNELFKLVPGRYISYFHNLQLKIRNFDIEADIAANYIDKSYYTKEGMILYVDFLIFKMSYLTQEIENALQKIANNKKATEKMYKYMTDDRVDSKLSNVLFYERDKFKNAFEKDVAAEINADNNKILFIHK